MILDTSYLIDLFDGGTAAFERGVALADADAVQRVPSPVATELTYGAAFGDEDERRSVRNALRLYPVEPLDAALARRAGELLAAADRDADGGSGVGTVDAMVAAVADSYDESVLTADEEDDRRLGVAVATY